MKIANIKGENLLVPFMAAHPGAQPPVEQGYLRQNI